MPGLFGAAGDQSHLVERLERKFAQIWGNTLVETHPSGAGLGAHSRGGSDAFGKVDGGWFARDGELRSTELDLEGFCGNEVRIMGDGSVSLRTDATGVFPLYFAGSRTGFVFSSLLKPLGDALGASVDPLGLSQMVRLGWTMAGRSVFLGIRRLQPGQLVRWDRDRGIAIEETSRIWCGIDNDFGSPEEAGEAAEPLLRSALLQGLHASAPNVLMASAGWDSRTLLGAASDIGIAPLVAYSHGDVESRELRLARAVAEAAGVRWTGCRIGPEVWGLEHLQRTFARTEYLLFPHWSWASRRNASAGCIFSGVLGESLGGHYIGTQVTQGVGKVISFFRGLRPGAGSDPVTAASVNTLSDLLLPERTGRLHYLRPGVEPDQGKQLREVLREDARHDLARLHRRGVSTEAQLLEAFITEHRGAQYIAAQARSSRTETDVALPFADHRLLELATRIPPHLKLHNRVSRALTYRLAPTLLDYPMAATLLPASSPLVLQEASRAARKAYEIGRWQLFQWTGGRTPRPRLGWVDFEFLRSGDIAHEVIDSLESDIWKPDALHGWVRRLQAPTDYGSLHPFFDQMGKILTVDRMLTPL